MPGETMCRKRLDGAHAAFARCGAMTNVHDNTARQRFELSEQGETAIAAYSREGDAIVFTHTEVPAALEGKGVGTRLVQGALAQVRAAGLKVVPACSFVAAYVERHPDEADLA